MSISRRDPRNDPKPGDILGYYLASTHPLSRKVISYDASTRQITYDDQKGRRRLTTRSEWRRWADGATSPPNAQKAPGASTGGVS